MKIAEIFAPQTLNLQKNRQKVFLWGILIYLTILILLVSVIEISGRAGLLQSWILVPSVRSGYPLFDIKINQLETLIFSGEQPNCLILGSSLAAENINPEVLAQTFEEQTGEVLNCYNFGLQSLKADRVAQLAQALLDFTHPVIIIYVTGARDFSTQHGDFSYYLDESAWLQYHLGDISPEGWLLANSYTYRYYYSLVEVINSDYAHSIAFYERNTRENGFVEDSIRHPLGALDLRTILSDFSLEADYWQGFVDLLALDSADLQIIVVETPLYPEFLPFYINGSAEAYQTEFISPLESELANHGIPFIRTIPGISGEIAAYDWLDNMHLAEPGAAQFSTWLGTELADVIHLP
jgi:hypothetical protein